MARWEESARSQYPPRLLSPFARALMLAPLRRLRGYTVPEPASVSGSPATDEQAATSTGCSTAGRLLAVEDQRGPRHVQSRIIEPGDSSNATGGSRGAATPPTTASKR